MFGKLQGNVLSIWDADKLNGASESGEPTPNYINITDSSFKSISSLPSPSGDLSNIIVLSTTMKNRYLLQFATAKLQQEWTAAMRLSGFEYSSLQEAYTGALLSSKGSKLNGIRTLLAETKFRHEDWVRVRFGSGMPWKKCWTVITPPDMKKKKKEPLPGTICFYEDRKKTKKPPLAVITSAWSTFAVYPEKSILVNGSTLIKIEGTVSFMDAPEPKDTSIFLMPEQHPGVQGFETLIRFLIPVLDVFKLYGRPKRLNADKGDMRSLLFGMPSLPRTQYLEVLDLVMLVGLSGSERWSTQEWIRNIKELLARKIATGYKGTGMVTSADVADDDSWNLSRQRAISNPAPIIVSEPSPFIGADNSSIHSDDSPRLDTVSENEQDFNGNYPVTNGSGMVAQREAPRAPKGPSPNASQKTLTQQESTKGQFPLAMNDNNSQGSVSSNYQSYNSSQSSLQPPPHQNGIVRQPSPQLQTGPSAPGHSALRGPPVRGSPQPPAHQNRGPPGKFGPPGANGQPGPPQHGGRYVSKAPTPLDLQPQRQQQQGPSNPYGPPQGSPVRPFLNRERSASVGTDPNNLIGQVSSGTKPLSPLPGAQGGFDQVPPHRIGQSQQQAPQTRRDIRAELFEGQRPPQPPVHSPHGPVAPMHEGYGPRPQNQQQQQQLQPGLVPTPQPRAPYPNGAQHKGQRIARRPVSGELAQSPLPPHHAPRNGPPAMNSEQGMFDPAQAYGESTQYARAHNKQSHGEPSSPASPSHPIRPQSPYFRTNSNGSSHGPLPPQHGQQYPTPQYPQQRRPSSPGMGYAQPPYHQPNQGRRPSGEAQRYRPPQEYSQRPRPDYY